MSWYWTIQIRTIIGRLTGYSECSACHNTWNWKKEQIIPFGKKAKNPIDWRGGMFPLCKECFETSTIDEIIYHCKCLLEHWIAETGNMDYIKNFDRYMDNIRHNVKELKR